MKEENVILQAINELNQKMEKGFKELEIQIKGNQEGIKGLQGEVKSLQDNVKRLQDDVKVLQDNVKVLQDNVKVLQDNVKVLQDDVKVLQDDMGELKGKIIPQIQEDIRKLSKTVAKIEVEHGEKLDALFDAFTMHSGKLEKHENRITICEKLLKKQDDEIYYLSSKI